MKAETLRFRMIILFCSVVAGLLAVSYLAFWALLDREVGVQLNRQLQETARPIIADLIAEPEAEDVNNLNIPDEFFALLIPKAPCCSTQKICRLRLISKELILGFHNRRLGLVVWTMVATYGWRSFLSNRQTSRGFSSWHCGRHVLEAPLKTLAALLSLFFHSACCLPPGFLLFTLEKAWNPSPRLLVTRP